MAYLIDTNAWIAQFENTPELSEAAASIMESDTSECFVSIASVWEASIKVGLGKLKLPYSLEHDLPRIFKENRFEILPLNLAEVTAVRDLPRIHGDPFDRIQVIQAQRRRLTVISRDAVFESYGLVRIW